MVSQVTSSSTSSQNTSQSTSAFLHNEIRQWLEMDPPDFIENPQFTIELKDSLQKLPEREIIQYLNSELEKLAHLESLLCNLKFLKVFILLEMISKEEVQRAIQELLQTRGALTSSNIRKICALLVQNEKGEGKTTPVILEHLRIKLFSPLPLYEDDFLLIYRLSYSSGTSAIIQSWVTSACEHNDPQVLANGQRCSDKMKLLQDPIAKLSSKVDWMPAWQSCMHLLSDGTDTDLPSYLLEAVKNAIYTQIRNLQPSNTEASSVQTEDTPFDLSNFLHHAFAIFEEIRELYPVDHLSSQMVLIAAEMLKSNNQTLREHANDLLATLTEWPPSSTHVLIGNTLNQLLTDEIAKPYAEERLIPYLEEIHPGWRNYANSGEIDWHGIFEQ